MSERVQLQAIAAGIDAFLQGRQSSVPGLLVEVSKAPLTPAAAFAQAHLSFALRRYREAIELFEMAAEEERLRVQAWTAAWNRASRAGWELQALALLRRLQAIQPGNAALLAGELASLGKRQEDQAAVPLARRLLELVPGSIAVRLELANALARLGDIDPLRNELEAIPADARYGSALFERIRLLVEADQLSQAERLAEDSLAAHPEEPLLWVWSARLASWRGEYVRAAQQAERALERDPALGDAHCALGAALFRQGLCVRAEESLARACALGKTAGEAHVWMAELLLERNATEEAFGHLNAATARASPHFSVSAWILRVIASTHRAHTPAMPFEITEEAAPALEELAPGAMSILRRGEPGAIAQLARRALAELGGNRSVQPTVLRDGVLRRLPLRACTGPRHASRAALERVRLTPPEEVARALDALEQRYPTSGLPACHRGELWLWLGQLDAAERDFQKAIARVKRTRFAWVGLTGVEMLRGDLERALLVSAEGVRVMMNTEGPAVFAYRGEVLRRLGRLDDAKRDLEQAVVASSNRLSASINLALTLHAQGDLPAAARLFHRVEDRAPALISDARREQETLGARVDDSSVLERSLTLMRGNRASGNVLYSSGGQLWTVPNTEGTLRHAHAHDAEELRAVRRWIARRLGGRA